MVSFDYLTVQSGQYYEVKVLKMRSGSCVQKVNLRTVQGN